MKFKADSKDAVIFCLFLIFLLYLVSLGVVNLAIFAQTGKLHGFNPMLAFTDQYLTATLTFYFVSVVVIIATVKSYFFETEKGFGISFSKSSKGDSRWARKGEMKKVLKRIFASDYELKSSGIPIISDGEEIYVDDGEAHSLIIGTTGSGKTRRLVHPLIRILAKKGESIIVTDPKGELYDENTSFLIERGYRIIVLNLRNPQQGNAWNPLQMPYKLYKGSNPDKATELLDDLAINILYEEKSSNADPFWEKTSADYFTGLALGLFEDARETEINLNSINLMTTMGEGKFGASTYMKEYFEAKDPSKPAYTNVASTLFAPSETKASILSVFKQKIKLFSSKENLSEMLSYSDFDIEDIGKEKTAVFMIIQDEKKTYHSLATIFVKQCYESLIDIAHANGGKLPIRTNFILDEFANMPPLKDVTTMITAARSRQIRFNLIIQNFAQLNQVYGKENAETIKGNCANLVYLLSSELGALKEISELCGEEKSKDKDAKGQRKPLISVNELQRLKMGDAIINKHRMHPFKTHLPDISKYGFDTKKYDKPILPIREKRKIDLFDIKEFVNELSKRKREKLFEMLDDKEPDAKPTMDFNVDDLVKKIDAKIAQLEEEERRERELKSNEINELMDDDKELEETINNELNKYKDDGLIINDHKRDEKTKNSLTDDQFFDDFFSEE